MISIHIYIYYNMIYVITIFYILAMNLHSWWFPQLNNYASHRLVRRPARNLPVPVACLRTGEATPGCFKVSTVRGIIPKSPYFRLVNYDLRWFNIPRFLSLNHDMAAVSMENLMINLEYEGITVSHVQTHPYMFYPGLRSNICWGWNVDSVWHRLAAWRWSTGNIQRWISMVCCWIHAECHRWKCLNCWLEQMVSWPCFVSIVWAFQDIQLVCMSCIYIYIHTYIYIIYIYIYT